MPEMRGDQLAASIRTIAPRPVILLTDFGELMQTMGEVPAGVTLILNKPVTLGELAGGRVHGHYRHMYGPVSPE